MTAAIEHGREARLPAAVDLWRDVERGSYRLDLLVDGGAVVALIGQNDAGPRAATRTEDSRARRDV